MHDIIAGAHAYVFLFYFLITDGQDVVNLVQLCRTYLFADRFSALIHFYMKTFVAENLRSFMSIRSMAVCYGKETHLTWAYP
jgi:hypothetical protein